MNDTQRRINQALSLRKPQVDSLDILVQILEKITLAKNMDTTEALRLIQEVCPSVKDFERAFPCICFAIATGVGKTRLMGAMIAYLHDVYKIKNFMVLAPNLTIYNKLKTDFMPNTPNIITREHHRPTPRQEIAAARAHNASVNSYSFWNARNMWKNESNNAVYRLAIICIYD